MQKPSIIVKDLSVNIQNARVLDGISFSLQAGQSLALLGDSASGKTTLANALAGKIHFSGEISIEENASLKGAHSTLVEQSAAIQQF
jgi:ABC-type multidrug transport system ATPase subunit